MGKTYKLDQQIDRRRLKTDVFIALVLVSLVVVVGAYIIFDLRSSGVVVNDDNNTPVLGSVEFEEKVSQKFTEAEFVVTLPENWIKLEEDRNSGILNAPGFQPYEYKGVDGKDAGRVLQIYVDQIPSDFPVSYLLEVEPKIGGLKPITSSTNCSGFTIYSPEEKGRPIASKWNGHSFVCNTIDYLNIGATVVDDFGDGVTISGPLQKHKYLFVYTDHSSKPDNRLFFDILNNFQAL